MNAGTIHIEIKLDGAAEVKQQLSQIGEQIKGGLGFARLALGVTAFNQVLGVMRTTMSAVQGTIGSTVEAYARFSKGLADVSTLLGDQSAKLLPKYERELLSISVRYGEAVESLTKPLYDLISAGVDVDKALELLEVDVKAAKAGIASTGTAVDAMTTVLNAWHMAVDKGAWVMDVFQTGIKRGKTTLEEIGGTISRVAPIAASLEIPFEQIIAAMATLTKQGTGTGEAFTQLSYALRAVLQNQERAKEMGPEVAAIFNKEAIQTMGLQKWMQALRDAVGGSEEKLVKLLGSAEAVNAVLGLTGENAKMAAEDLAAMQSASGAVAEGFENIKKSFAFQWERLKTTFHNLAIAVGGMLAPSFQVLASAVQPLIRVFVVLAGYYSALPGIIKAVVPAVAALTAAFVAFKLGVFASVIPSITAIWTALSPILPILGAISAAVALFAVAWKTNFAGIKDTVLKVWRVVKAVLKIWWNNVKQFLKTIWTMFKPAVESIWKTVKQTHENVKPYAKYLMVILALPFLPVITAIAGAITAFTIFKNAFLALAEGIKPIASALLDLLVAVFNPKNWLHPKKAIADVKNAMGELSRAVRDTAKEAFEGMVEDAKSAYEQVKDVIQQTKTEIASARGEEKTLAGTGVSPSARGTTTGGGGAGPVMPLTLTAYPGGGQLPAGEEMPVIPVQIQPETAGLAEAIKDLQNNFNQAISSIQSAFEGLFEDVFTGKIKKAEDAFRVFAKNIGAILARLAAKDLATALASPIRVLLQQAGAYIVSAVAAIIKWFANLGPWGIPAGLAAAAGLVAAFTGFKHALGFAEGGLITEPMIAFSLSGAVPAIIGESGPEVVAPKEKFDDLYARAQEPKIVIQATILDKEALDSLYDRLEVLDKLQPVH